MAELTAEALTLAWARGEPETVVALLRGRSERERRAVAPAILRAQARCREHVTIAVTPAGGVEWREQGMGTTAEQVDALRTAALGVCTLSQLRRDGGVPSLQPAVAVLGDRRPPWVAEWALLADWSVGRALTRAGICPPLREDAHIEALIMETSRWGPHRPGELLRVDPELLEHEVWRLFEVEGRTINLESAERERQPGWNAALREAAADGRLDRARLLDATLEALTRDFGAYRNRWYTRLHTDLEPSPQEQIGFAERYLDQLHNPFEETAAWALDRVDQLDRHHPLDGEPLLSGLAAVITSKRKRTVLKALAVLARIAARDPVRAAGCATLAAEALVHEAPDVQAEALALRPPPEVLARFHDVIAPSNRALIGASPEPTAGVDLDGIDLDAITPRARAALELDAALTAARAGSRLPLPSAPPDEPRLEAAIEPIANLEELATVLFALDHREDETALERALDAIARFCGSRDAFSDPLQRLLPTEQAARRLPLRGVLRAWATGTARFETERSARMARMRELADRCIAGDAGPLLAAPTHQGGWIDPRIFVARAGRRPLDPHSPDLVSALLRLAPEHRDPALAADLEGPAADAVRCALGGPDPGGSTPATIAARLARLPPLLAPPKRHAVWKRFDESLLPAVDGLPWSWDVPIEDEPGDLDAAFPWAIRRGGDEDEVEVEVALLSFRRRPESIEVLLSPGEPLTPFAARQLAVDLGDDDAGIRLLAVDIAIAGIGDGRLDADLLAASLRQPLSWSFSLTRFARSLTAVAAVSVLHAETVRETLDGLLADRDSPKGLLPVLTLLNELCEDAGAAVRRRALLESLTGSSKTAKTARALLARTGGSRHPVAALAFAARMRRAERWSAKLR